MQATPPAKPHSSNSGCPMLNDFCIVQVNISPKPITRCKTIKAKCLDCVGINVYLATILVNMLELIAILSKWRWKILIPTIICTLIAIIASLPALMPPKYDSTAVFYVANPSASDRNAIFNSENGYTNYFGGSDDIDRILSLLQSPMFSDYMIKKFSLQNHYGQKDAYYTNLEWANNFSAMKNDLGAIEVKATDTDALLSKKMADATLLYVDSAYKHWIMSARKQVLQAIEQEISSLSKDNEDGVLAKLQLTRAQVRTSYSDDYATLYITEYPQIALKKSSPVRWIIVLGAVLAALFFFSLVAVVLEKIREHTS